MTVLLPVAAVVVVAGRRNGPQQWKRHPAPVRQVGRADAAPVRQPAAAAAWRRCRPSLLRPNPRCLRVAPVVAVQLPSDQDQARRKQPVATRLSRGPHRGGHDQPHRLAPVFQVGLHGDAAAGFRPVDPWGPVVVSVGQIEAAGVPWTWFWFWLWFVPVLGLRFRRPVSASASGSVGAGQVPALVPGFWFRFRLWLGFRCWLRFRRHKGLDRVGDPSPLLALWWLRHLIQPGHGTAWACDGAGAGCCRVELAGTDP